MELVKRGVERNGGTGVTRCEPRTRDAVSHMAHELERVGWKTQNTSSEDSINLISNGIDSIELVSRNPL